MSEALYAQFANDLSFVLARREKEAADELRFVETCELIASCADHEAKALTLLTMWQEDAFLGEHALHTAVIRRQGNSPSWTPNHRLAFNYCKGSLEPIGAVVKGDAPKLRGEGGVIAYKISERGIEIGVPAAGLVLDWSLKYPDISIQQLLGLTGTNAERRAPETRTNLFLDLISNPEAEKGIATHEIRGITPVPSTNFQQNIDYLDRIGLVAKESSVHVNDRQFRVRNNVRQGDRELGEKSQLLYDYLGTKQIGDVFTYQEALEHFIEVFAQRGISQDGAEVRRWLHISIGATTTNRFPEIERLALYNRGRLTRVKPVAEHAEAIEDLCNIILAIESGDSAVLEAGRQMAARIIASPQAVSTLMQKAYEYSPKTRMDTEKATKLILQIIERSEHPMETEEVERRYAALTEPALTYQSVRRYLNKLSSEGKIAASKQRKDEDRKNQKNFYHAKGNNGSIIAR